MEEKDLEEVLASSESVISLLLSDSCVEEFTDKVNGNDNYEIIGSYLYADKFKKVLELNLVTSFSLKLFKNKNTGAEFLRYKVCVRVPTKEGVRYFSSNYGVGYNTKELFKTINSKVDTEHLPIEWLKKLKIETKRRKSDGEKFVNADFSNINALLSLGIVDIISYQ